MLTRNGVLGLMIAASLGLTRPMAAQAPRLNLSEKALSATASKYVVEYEKQFAFLIADEHYTQTLFNAGSEVHTRVITSELFLTYLQGDAEWVAVRDVSDVDGIPVSNRQDLRALLTRQRGEIRGIAAEVVARNARYNIGRIERNFNEPTLPLLLLEPKRLANVKFDRKAIVRDGNTTVVSLAFEERNNALTLVSSRTEGRVPATGEFVIDAVTGTIRSTVFTTKNRSVNARLETVYAKDEKLGLWLPSVFTERYETPVVRQAGGLYRAPMERVQCEARYSNYRRFDVTATIKR